MVVGCVVWRFVTCGSEIWDFDRKLLHVMVQSKGNKDRYIPLSEHLIRGIKKYIAAEHPQDYLFGGQPQQRKRGDFDSRYSQRGVQWAVSTVAKQAGIIKEVHTHMLRHTYASICSKMV
ncbi:MAG: tyrosine-type recombinase/integrase [Chitinophagaceae bacterium]